MTLPRLQTITITNLNVIHDARSSEYIEMRPLTIAIAMLDSFSAAALAARASLLGFSGTIDFMNEAMARQEFYDSLRAAAPYGFLSDPFLTIPASEHEPALRNYARILNRGRPRKLSWRRLNRPQRMAAGRLWMAGYLGCGTPELGQLHPEHFRPLT